MRHAPSSSNICKLNKTRTSWYLNMSKYAYNYVIKFSTSSSRFGSTCFIAWQLKKLWSCYQACQKSDRQIIYLYFFPMLHRRCKHQGRGKEEGMQRIKPSTSTSNPRVEDMVQCSLQAHCHLGQFIYH